MGRQWKLSQKPRIAVLELFAFGLLCFWIVHVYLSEQTLLRRAETRLGSTPSVSIILPVFNSLNYIHTAIDALNNQSFRDIEVVVIDDGSTDGTSDVVSYWAASRPEVTYTKVRRNGGLPAALNVGHKIAKGELVTWISADNLQYTNFTGILHGALKLHPECDVAFADHNKISETGGLLAPHVLRKAPRATAIVKGNPGLAAFMYRRSCFDAAGPYREDLQGVEDWELWGRMLGGACKRAVYVPTMLMGYRLHGASLTGRLGQLLEIKENEARRIIWEGMGKTAGIIQADSLMVDLVWDQHPDQSRVCVLIEAAQSFADAHMRHPSSSLLDVLKDALSACASVKPATLHATLCAVNLVAVAAAYGGHVTVDGVEEARAYALYVYGQVAEELDLGDRARKILKSAPPPATPLHNTWVAMITPPVWRKLRRLVDTAYTADPESARPSTLFVVSDSPVEVHSDARAMFENTVLFTYSDALTSGGVRRVRDQISKASPRSVLHLAGESAVADMCRSGVPDHVTLVAEVTGMHTECGDRAVFVVAQADTARALVESVGVARTRVFVRSASVSDVVLYRLALATITYD